MQSVGTRLREARIKKGYTLEEINARTRISLKNLTAIESDDLTKISSPFTYRSFVKQFSDAVGLDHATLAADAQESSKTMPEVLVPGQEEEPYVRPHQFQPQRKPKPAWNWVSAASVAGVAGVLAVYLLFRSGGISLSKPASAALPAASEVIAPSAPVSQPASPSTQPIIAPTPVPSPAPVQTAAATTPESEPVPGTEQLLPPSQIKKQQPQQKKPEVLAVKVPPPVAATPAPAASESSAALVQNAIPTAPVADITPAHIHIELSATPNTWLSISADGRTTYSGKLTGNQTVSFEGRESAQIRTDNAAGVKIIFNGKALRSMGRPGQARTFVFTKSGYEVVQGLGSSTALARAVPTGGQ